MIERNFSDSAPRLASRARNPIASDSAWPRALSIFSTAAPVLPCAIALIESSSASTNAAICFALARR